MQAQKVLATLLLRLSDRGSDSQQAGKTTWRSISQQAKCEKWNAGKMESKQNGKQAEWKAMMQD
jgi:hypothetical protein